MAVPQKVVLLSCGSFNPPTNMHLRMFELAKDALQRNGKYTVIGGIISPVSDRYNKKDLTSAKHRCAMVRLAIKSAKWIRLDTWESEQPVWSETARVLLHHRIELDNQANANIRATPSKKRKKDKRNEDELDRGIANNNPARHTTTNDHDSVQLKLLCGGDLLESFSVPGLWKDEDIEEIVGMFGLVCITRCGSDPRKFIYESDVLTKHQDKIHIVTEWIQNEISSTKIRRSLRRAESVKYLIQDSVIDYIKEHELYGYTSDNKNSEKCPPSPPIIDQLMDYVDGPTSNYQSLIINPVDDIMAGSPKRLVDRSRSPKLQDVTRSGSPKRLTGSHLPKLMMTHDPAAEKAAQQSPQPACMSDISTIVRRVRNVRVGFTPETRVFAYATETCV